MERDRQIFLSFWAIFCTFTLLTTSKIKILKKWKKNSEDIIILHKCTINDNHMMYVSWDMERDRHNFLSFWAIFCPFTPTNNLKNQNFEKIEKNPEDTIILQKCTKNHHHILCSLDMARDECNLYISFWAISCPFITLTARKIKKNKNLKKVLWDIIILYKRTKN